MNQNNNNIDFKTNQNVIYNKIKSNDFSNAPQYSNGLDINNANLSSNNKPHFQQLSKITKFNYITPLEILYKEQYGKFNKTTNEREKCPICLCEFYDNIITDSTNSTNLDQLDKYISQEIDTVKLFRCEDHFYHIECLLNYINQQTGFKCAICQKIYGIIIGNMPPGTISVNVNDKLKCAGFPNNGTIVLSYNFKSGTINGKSYKGTSRMNYIPNNKEGRILLGLLKIAFDRKLTFTIGTSVTTGQQDCVVWNGIHHKSQVGGGASNYGYPDPTYFNRVSEELAAKGVIKDEFEEDDLEFLAVSLMYG